MNVESNLNADDGNVCYLSVNCVNSADGNVQMFVPFVDTDNFCVGISIRIFPMNVSVI